MQQVHDPFVNDDQHGMILDTTGLTLFPSLSSTCPAGRTWRKKRESGRDSMGRGASMQVCSALGLEEAVE